MNQGTATDTARQGAEAAGTQASAKAKVEQIGPGEWRVRCGNPQCLSRKFGNPLSTPHTLCQVQSTGPWGVRLLCDRCGKYSDVEIG